MMPNRGPPGQPPSAVSERGATTRDERDSVGEHEVEVEPARKVAYLALDCCAHRGRELHVTVHGGDPQLTGSAVGGGIDLPHQPVVVEDQQREIASAARGCRLEHLELVVEVEDLGHPLAIVEQPVER